jgi:hypothetical protein
MTESSHDALKTIVSALAGGAYPDKGRLEQIFGVPLDPVAGVPPQQSVYAATLASGPIVEVEFRGPPAGKREGVRFVVLKVRPAPELNVRDLAGKLFPPEADRSFNPRIPPDGTVSFIVERPGLTARFQFGAKSELLQLMSFEWAGPVDPSLN